SAEWAAEAIASGHQFASDLYRYRVREGIGSELTRAADFKDGFFRAEFTTLMMDAVAHSGAIRRVVTDLIAGRQRYETLKWRLVRTLSLVWAGGSGRATGKLWRRGAARGGSGGQMVRGL